MIIHTPTITSHNGAARYSVLVEFSGGTTELWFDVGSGFENLCRTTADPFLVALLLVAMRRREDIDVRGTLSERLYYNFTHHCQAVACSLIPGLSPVRIHAGDVLATPAESQGVSSGFSGGVDSFCVLADHHFDASVPAGYRITHLVFNNVGSISAGSNRLAHMQQFARELGLPLVAVESNLSELFARERLGFQLTHTFRNVAAALLLQEGIRRFLYASTYSYPAIQLGPTYDCAYGDPIVLPLLSTESMEAISVGSQYDRVAKTVKIAGLPLAQRALHVCVSQQDNANNCSRCFKCLRTLLTLEIAGRLDDFATAFDLPVYRTERIRYMARILAGEGQPFTRDIMAFASASGFRFPAAARFYRGVEELRSRLYWLRDLANSRGSLGP